MKRKAQFTIANLIGVFLLVFIAMALWPILSEAVMRSYNGANLLTKAAVVLILPSLFVGILGYILTSSERVEQPRQQRGVPGRRRRVQQ